MVTIKSDAGRFDVDHEISNLERLKMRGDDVQRKIERLMNFVTALSGFDMLTTDEYDGYMKRIIDLLYMER